MAYSGARGTLIYEKNLKSKISCQTPFKGDMLDLKCLFSRDIAVGDRYVGSTAVWDNSK
jgi:hypothetical protein